MSKAEPPSRQTLDEVPKRVLDFLMAIVEVPAIASAMASKGYKQSDHDYALSRLSRLAVVPERALEPTLDPAIRRAVVELDAWDEPNFSAIKATLERLHPEQADYVFNALTPKQGREAVIAVGTLLDRLDDLQSSEARVATRDADTAALATLADRGYTPGERARLRGLIAKATTVVPVAPLSDADRVTILIALHAWHTDWSASARLVITRRDHLIRLGIAKRRKSRDGGGGTSGGGGTTGGGGSSGGGGTSGGTPGGGGVG